VDTFSIAFVCTGNRFRSPLAEAFVHRLTLELPVSVGSYGTLELENAPPLPEAAEIALSCGISLADHRTRYLNNASLEDVDLLLGFEPAHIRQAVVDGRAPRERSFTMRDFAEANPEIDVSGKDSAQKLAILASLWAGPLYGLEILRQLERDSALVLSEGTIYPLLARLKSEGLLDSEWVEAEGGHPRKYYRLTPRGRQRVREMAQVWSEFAVAMKGLLSVVLRGGTK
jgi:PadR family transcriptional regulator PadR